MAKMKTENQHEHLISLIADLKEKRALQLVSRLLKAGDSPKNILKTCEEGMRRVGKNYENGEYYISGLIMGGEIMRQIATLLSPALGNEKDSTVSSGKILIGTVQGDIHDIGKDLVRIFLSGEGFDVIDLGVDVPPEEFANKTVQFHPDIVGLSALINIVYESMRDTVALLRQRMKEEGMSIPIIIGGGAVNEEVRKYVEADYWASNIRDAIRIIRKVVIENSSSD